jgi:SAM-dependent methyltransferase
LTVSDHYARNNLIDAIHDGVVALGKTASTVTVADLAPIDEFHIGGRKATEELVSQLQLSSSDHVLDIGCGLGGAARFIAERHHCHVVGVDLTRDYVEAGQMLCEWVGLADRVSLHQADALSIPFAWETFSAAYMLHAGMNIADKVKLCSEAARVLKPGSFFAIYDVTGFTIVSERDRREFALAYFDRLRSTALPDSTEPPLGLHTLMGNRRKDQVRNMIEKLRTFRPGGSRR